MSVSKYNNRVIRVCGKAMVAAAANEFSKSAAAALPCNVQSQWRAAAKIMLHTYGAYKVLCRME